MFTKKLFPSVLSLIIMLAIIITIFPTVDVSAKSQPATIKSFCTNEHDDEWEPHAKAKNYLVLIGQTDGTYVAYDKIAFVTSHDKVMVKAKPLATALGLTYQNTSGGHGRKKGCVLTLGNKKNVYLRNSKTYYYYNNTKKITKAAEYKQFNHQSYNSVHCATLSTLVSFQYYDTLYVTDYETLGYRGVVVYNKYSSIAKLPDIKNVTNLHDDDDDDDDGDHDNNIDAVTNIKITPLITYNNSYGDVKFIEASYSTTNSKEKIQLDLSEVINTFMTYGLPFDGIYGYGNCETDVTLKGIDKNGYSVGEIKTSGKEFLINFPGAVKLNISGSRKNLLIDFTPVKPIVITTATKLAFSQISWLYPIDGFARQYFVLSEYMKFSLENVILPYTISRKMLDINNTDAPDYSSSYQRITAVFKGTREEMTSNYRFIDVKGTNQIIDNSLVVFNTNGSAVLPANYETELNNMITKLISTGINNYFPSKNFESKLVMKLPDGLINSTYSYITVNPSILDLNHFLDYYTHLHEMIHFYEAKQLHYGFQFAAWNDGNAITLAKKTMTALGKSTADSFGVDYFNTFYATNYSFLTQDNKNNFESYYLNATGGNASVIGYHFTNFLQEYYGSDVVYRIMQKVYAAKIPTNTARSSVYDKQFTDCIKSVTSTNVFQLFVKTCID